MKKFLAITLISAAAAVSAFAQTATPTPSGLAFSFTPTTQNASAGGAFNVTLSLSGTTPPANISGYDVYLVTDAATAGFFTLTAAAPSAPFDSFASSLVGGASTFTKSTGVAGLLETNHDINNLSSSASGFETPTNGTYVFTLDNLAISIDGNTPAGTYAFFTSTPTNTTNGTFGSVSDSAGIAYSVGQGSFQITVVPEPATWSLLALGGVGCVGLGILRRRRTA